MALTSMKKVTVIDYLYANYPMKKPARHETSWLYVLMKGDFEYRFLASSLLARSCCTLFDKQGLIYPAVFFQILNNSVTTEEIGSNYSLSNNRVEVFQ